jgi:uncharacterized lipoprotein YbaY
MGSSLTTVNGSVTLPDQVAKLDPANVHVTLYDTSWQDAPAELVPSDVTLSDLRADGFDFELKAGGLSERNDYSIAIHVDTDGSGTDHFSVGDYLNTTTVPVTPAGGQVAVTLERVDS